MERIATIEHLNIIFNSNVKYLVVILTRKLEVIRSDEFAPNAYHYIIMFQEIFHKLISVHLENTLELLFNLKLYFLIHIDLKLLIEVYIYIYITLLLNIIFRCSIVAMRSTSIIYIYTCESRDYIKTLFETDHF